MKNEKAREERIKRLKGMKKKALSPAELRRKNNFFVVN